MEGLQSLEAAMERDDGAVVDGTRAGISRRRRRYIERIWGAVDVDMAEKIYGELRLCGWIQLGLETEWVKGFIDRGSEGKTPQMHGPDLTYSLLTRLSTFM